MKVHFQQIYIEQGAEFPFSHIFQKYASVQVSSLVSPSATFILKYGEDFELTLNISAKHSLEEIEIRGPTVFKNDKDVEYSIFVPCRYVFGRENPARLALNYIFEGAYSVFDMLDIDSVKVQREQDRIFNHICSESTMFRVSRHAGSGVGPPVWNTEP